MAEVEVHATIPIEEQVRIVAEHIHSSLNFVRALLDEAEEELKAMAISRVVVTGYENYGDQSFHLDGEQLIREILPELADAAVYGSIYLNRRGK